MLTLIIAIDVEILTENETGDKESCGLDVP